ncbi:MAG: hypothetical protein AB1513_00450 [Pseudomonadota bacterium]|jgi:hypothetical protein
MQHGYNKESKVYGRSRLARCAGIIAAILFPTFCIGTIAHAADEIQVYTDDINDPGKAALELHTNYVIEGRRDPSYPGELAPHHVFNLTPEFSYGVTRRFELGLYLPFSHDVGNSSGYSNGIKFRAKWLNVGEAGDGFYGVNFELSNSSSLVSEDRWNAEIRPIFGVAQGAWSFAVNPILGLSISGASQRPEFKPAVKIDRNISEDFKVGVEHYASLGLLDNMVGAHDQSHTTYLVTDFKAAGYDFNLGIGRGWRNADEQWTVKLIIGGIPLGE